MSTATSSQRCHCFFSGRVQGVGFRYRTCNLAINYNVAGFVRNLADGRVELVAEGPDDEVAAFLEAVNERLKSHIQVIERSEEPASGDYSQFVISR